MLKGGEITEMMMCILGWGLATATLDAHFNEVNWESNCIEGITSVRSHKTQQWGSVKIPH